MSMYQCPLLPTALRSSNSIQVESSTSCRSLSPFSTSSYTLYTYSIPWSVLYVTDGMAGVDETTLGSIDFENPIPPIILLLIFVPLSRSSSNSRSTSSGCCMTNCSLVLIEPELCDLATLKLCRCFRICNPETSRMSLLPALKLLRVRVCGELVTAFWILMSDLLRIRVVADQTKLTSQAWNGILGKVLTFRYN